jgi:hypothetical protein
MKQLSKEVLELERLFVEHSKLAPQGVRVLDMYGFKEAALEFVAWYLQTEIRPLINDTLEPLHKIQAE